jgi:probable HAF family extracellular repeat protein
MWSRPLTIAFRWAGLLFLIGTVLSQAHADPITYNVTDMGHLIAQGFDVNGNVVGQYAGNNVYYSFATSGSNPGSLQLSSTPPTMPGWNDPTSPGNAPGYSWTAQYGGNAAGQATGLAGQTLSNGQQGVYYAWVYSGGQFTVFPQQYPYSPQINAAGQVVFNANDISGNAHGYLYSNGQVTDVGTLPVEFRPRSRRSTITGLSWALPVFHPLQASSLHSVGSPLGSFIKMAQCIT